MSKTLYVRNGYRVGDFDGLVKAAFGPHVVATEIPIGSEHDLRGLVDLIDMKAYEYDGDGRDNCREIPIPDDVRDQAEEYRECCLCRD